MVEVIGKLPGSCCQPAGRMLAVLYPGRACICASWFEGAAGAWRKARRVIEPTTADRRPAHTTLFAASPPRHPRHWRSRVRGLWTDLPVCQSSTSDKKSCLPAARDRLSAVSPSAAQLADLGSATHRIAEQLRADRFALLQHARSCLLTAEPASVSSRRERVMIPRQWLQRGSP